jgi:hypothetical protein
VVNPDRTGWLPRLEVTTGLPDGSTVARHDTVIGQPLIGTSIRPILIERAFGMATPPTAMRVNI